MNTPIKNRANQRSDDGMTLIEVMISISVMLVAALIMTSATVTTAVQSEGSKQKSLAMQQAKSLLEQMSAVPIGSLPEVFPHDEDVAAFNDQGVEGLRMKVSYADGQTTARPLHYEVEAKWNGPRGREWSTVIRGVRAR